MEVSELAAWINEAHGIDFFLKPRLAGGYQDGAFPLVDGTGRTFVLKCDFAPRALPLLRELHALGYPTPETFFAGETPDGARYVVQAFLPGGPPDTLTLPLLEQILEIVELQANRNPAPSEVGAESWSRYARTVVFENESGWTALLRSRPDTCGLLDEIEALTAPLAGLTLPDADIVHGDFNLGNILVENGRITGVIDMLYAGYGTRALDLATLLHFAWVKGGDEAVRRRLTERIESLVGHGGLCLCLAYRMLAMLAWAVERDPDAVENYLFHGRRIVRELSSG